MESLSAPLVQQVEKSVSSELEQVEQKMADELEKEAGVVGGELAKEAQEAERAFYGARPEWPKRVEGFMSGL